jgi:hypothetical protein
MMSCGGVVPDWMIQRADWWEIVLGSADPSFSLSRWVSTDCPSAGFFQFSDLLHPIPLIHGFSIVHILASLTSSSSSSSFFVFFICGASSGFRVMAGLPDLLPPTLALALVSAIERQQATNYVGLASHFVHFCVYSTLRIPSTANVMHYMKVVQIWDALHVILLAHRNLKWLLDIWKICTQLQHTIRISLHISDLLLENVGTQNQIKCYKFSGFHDGCSANVGNLLGGFKSRSAFGFFLRKWINKFCSVTLNMEAERPTETFIRTTVLPTQLSFTALRSTIAKSHVLSRCTICDLSFPGSQEICTCSQSNPTYKQTNVWQTVQIGLLTLRDVYCRCRMWTGTSLEMCSGDYYNNNNNNNNNNTFTGEITLHVAQIANSEQLQNYIIQQHGLFQVYCKYST